MKIDSPEDRLLFLRYALPCAGTLVNRGKVSQRYVDQAVRLVSQNKAPRAKVEGIFKIANAMCGSIAKRMRKRNVDSKVIRQYFLLEHSDVVEDRYKLMGDFDPESCKTYPGTVTDLKNGKAVVKTSLGRKT